MAIEYFDTAAFWFKKAGKQNESVAMMVQVAEGWVKKANAVSLHTLKAGFLENAVQKYRSIPKADRSAHNVDQRVEKLRSEMRVAGRESLGEMVPIASEPTDITDLIEQARNEMRGKSERDALITFANIYGWAKATQIREMTTKSLNQSPLADFFSSTHLSRDGRVVARRPAGELDEGAVWERMVRNYCWNIELVVKSRVWPALEILHLEHRFRESDFINIARHSPIVPYGRERLFGKALFSGYDRDFISSLHVLIPQLENLIRWLLHQRGVGTTTLDSKGIETENGLSALMELPEANEIFGEDLAFELKVLLCTRIGPNLRNDLAHGLLPPEICESFYAVYVWWLGFSIIFNAFLSATKTSETGGVPGTNPDT